MTLLFSNHYATLDLEQSVVRYVRNSEPFNYVEELIQSHTDVSRVLDRLGRARYAFLVDLREARVVSSAEHELAMGRERKRLLYGFARVGVLVKSAAGALQVQRHAREDGITLRVFLDDERAALAYVRGSNPTSERSPVSGVIESVPPSAPESVRSNRFGAPPPSSSRLGSMPPSGIPDSARSGRLASVPPSAPESVRSGRLGIPESVRSGRLGTKFGR